MTKAQSGYNSSRWSPFSQGGLNLEEFIIDVHIPSLLPFFVKEFIDYSFPFTPMWLGIQHNFFLWLDIESSLQSNLTINGFSSFLFSNDVNTESESENMINLCLSREMMLRARSIAHTSAVKMELSIGRAFLRIILFLTAAHAVLLLSFEPSVKTCKCSEIQYDEIFQYKCRDGFLFWGVHST